MALTTLKLDRGVLAPGVYGDGDRLFIRVVGKSKAWVFIYKSPVTDKRREYGLGGYPAVSIATARKLAQDCRNAVALGRCPVEEKKQAKAAKVAEAEGLKVVEVARARTLAVVADEWVAMNERSWTLAGAARYRGYIKNHLGPLGALPIGDVRKIDVSELLRPVWNTPTGSFLRSFLERVFDYAVFKGDRVEGLNPASLKAVRDGLPKKVKYRPTHRKALPWETVPHVMKALAAKEGVGPACLRFAILCGLRQKEARELRWGDVREDRIVIPADRYKTKVEHVVPITKGARAILDEQGRASNRDPNGLVFVGRLEGRPISHHTFEYLLEDLKFDCQPHGFRTSLVDYGVRHGQPNDIMQRCLGHIVLSETERAYNRHDYFAEKQEALDAWGRYLT